VSDPENPVFRSQYAPINGAGQVLSAAGVLALTPLESGRYLMMTTGGENRTWFYYRSTLTDLSSPNLSWDYVGSHPAPSGEFAVQHAHQTLQFLRQGDITGDLFLAGARGHFHEEDANRIDLYLIQGDTDEFLPGESLELTTIRRGKRMSRLSTLEQPGPSSLTTGAGGIANLAAASTFHVTPTGELLFYATRHDNVGPGGSLTLGEWRDIDMARPGSPTRLPTIELNGPFEVEEGGRVSLTGSKDAPLARAWVQLFHEPDFGGADFHSKSVVADFDDRALDDFDDLGKLLANNKARSVKWYAPSGCSILLQDFASGSALTLNGDNFVHSEPSLGSLDSRIDRVEFRSDCESHFNRPYILAWDLDRNGSFETEGTLAFFSAASLDGPAEIDIRAQARHIVDSGPTAEATARVSVRNARPQVTDFRLSGVTNGLAPNSTPTVLMGLPVTVDATFADAGVRDRQNAWINWGDGAVDADSAFATFADAFGGAIGRLSQSHRYSAAGVREILISVRDDDSGVGTSKRSVLVQSPAEWVQVAITRIDLILAGTTDETVRQHLAEARLALAGTPKRPGDGALSLIASGNFAAAIEPVNRAIASLGAVSGSVETQRLVSLLETVVSSLVALSSIR
jgi:hypothetical protein